MQYGKPKKSPILMSYTYVKRLDPKGSKAADYECFVGTSIPNDNGLSLKTTSTFMLTEAGTGNLCSRMADPLKSGIKITGTKINGPSNIAFLSSCFSFFDLKFKN